MRRTYERLGVKPERLAADAAYGSAPLLSWLLGEGVEPHIPVIDRGDQTHGKLSRSAFTYDPASDSFTCPEGHELTYRGMDRRAGAHTYFAKPADCAACPAKPACSDGPARRVIRPIHEEARDHVRALKGTSGYARSRKLRKRIERLFGHLKRNMKFTRLKLRGLSGAAEEFLLAATAQNLQLLAGITPPASVTRGQRTWLGVATARVLNSAVQNYRFFNSLGRLADKGGNYAFAPVLLRNFGLPEARGRFTSCGSSKLAIGCIRLEAV